MSIKEILVHMNGSDSRAARLDAAFKIAAPHDAHITGLYVVPQQVIPPYASVHIPAEVFENQERELRQTAAKSEAEFHSALDDACRVGQWLLQKGVPQRRLCSRASYADLLVMSQPDPHGLLAPDTAVEHAVLLGCGRPVLFVPRAAKIAALGRHVLLAWNGSREAARAARDALPLLVQADRVDVLAVDPPQDQAGVSTADVCTYLARHGVNAVGRDVKSAKRLIGQVILSQAATLRSDLIVTGGYGHSRLAEIVLGGVTEHLFEQADLPVLMSH